eukprot:SAG31_NODE_5307_length_2620_cov_2.005157_2_plen_51_part_00
MQVQYKLLHPIGQGAGGVVCAVQDRTTGSMLAMKQVPRLFIIIIINLSLT